MVKIDLSSLDDEQLTVLIGEIQKIKDPDAPHWVFIFPQKARKTLPQVRYYWGVVLEDIADQTGYWPEELHEYNKKLFSVKSTFFVEGEAMEVIRGMAKFHKKEMSDFIEKVISFWSEKGVIIRRVEDLELEQIAQAHTVEIDE